MRILLPVIFLSLLNFSCKSFAEPEAYFTTSFEEADAFSKWENDQHCCEYSITRSTETSTEGKYSARFEIRKTDPPTSRSIRAELVKGENRPGDESWYGFNMLLKDWKEDNAGEHVFQWHPLNSSAIATAALWTSGGRFVFQTNTGGKNFYVDIGPVITNEWTSWVLHFKWETTNTGHIQLWKNGELMIDRRNVRTITSDGNYFKLGINKFGWGIQPSTTESRILYFDDVRIGDETASFEKISPGKISSTQ